EDPAPVLPAHVPKRLRRLVARLLDKDPASRLPSTAGVESALDAPVTRMRLLAVAAVLTAAVARAFMLRRMREPTDAALHPGADRRSVAVLPFGDLSPRKDQEYLSDGIAEEILNALADIRGIRVAARSSSFAFKGKIADIRAIGRALDVGTVVEGSVRQDGGR